MTGNGPGDVWGGDGNVLKLDLGDNWLDNAVNFMVYKLHFSQAI